jgi:hypothetical protein
VAANFSLGGQQFACDILYSEEVMQFVALVTGVFCGTWNPKKPSWAVFHSHHNPCETEKVISELIFC